MDNLGQAGNNGSEEECPICLESLNKSLCLSTACKHKFHTHCLLGWIERNRDKNGKRCPMCEASLEERDTFYTYVDQNGAAKQESVSPSDSKLTKGGGAEGGKQTGTSSGHDVKMEKRMRELEDRVRRLELRAENAEKRAERAVQVVQDNLMTWSAQQSQRNLFTPGNLMRRESELNRQGNENASKLRKIRDELVDRFAHFSRLRANPNPGQDSGRYGTPQECMDWLENINRF